MYLVQCLRLLAVRVRKIVVSSANASLRDSIGAKVIPVRFFV